MRRSKNRVVRKGPYVAAWVHNGKLVCRHQCDGILARSTKAGAQRALNTHWQMVNKTECFEPRVMNVVQYLLETNFREVVGLPIILMKGRS